MVIAAYPLGGLFAIPVIAPIPTVTTAVVLPAWIILVTGITHLDGLADCGDAAVVHDDRDRKAILKDSAIGVGGVTAVGIALLGVATAGYALTAVPVGVAIGAVVAAEVGAKAGMAAVACVGEATHDGLGAALARPTAPLRIGLVGILALPAIALTWPTPVAAGTLGATVLASGSVYGWARRSLGGISGDVLGATNELARLAGLHAGVLVWTLL